MKGMENDNDLSCPRCDSPCMSTIFKHDVAMHDFKELA